MIKFLREFKAEKRKEEQEKISIERMHEERLSVMNRFIDILAKK